MSQRPNRARCWRGGVIALMLALAVVGPQGCGKSTSNLESYYALAGGGVGARGAAGQAMRQAWYQDEVKLQELLDLAHQRVENPADRQSAVFALAVLDVIQQVDEEIDREKVNEFFWMRVGTLAGNAAAVAYGLSPKDTKLAESLVLAGGKRWQENESYWMRNPEHDTLVALIMHEQGQSQDALERLKSRVDFNETRLAAIKKIEDEIRRKRGG